MAIDTKTERKRAWDFGRPWWPWPFPTGELDSSSRAHIWDSYFAGSLPVPVNPYYISDHCERSLALLIEQFKPATELKKLICAIVDQLQITEDEANKLILFRSINNSQVVQLDGVGSIVG